MSGVLRLSPKRVPSSLDRSPSFAQCPMLCCFCHPRRVIRLILPSKTAFLIICIRISPIMRKKYGARGHPCLAPLSILKMFLGLLLRLSVVDAFPNMSLIQLMNFLLIPNVCIAWNENL